MSGGCVEPRRVCPWLYVSPAPPPGCLKLLARRGFTHIVSLATRWELAVLWDDAGGYRREALEAGLVVIEAPVADGAAPEPEAACMLARMLAALADRGARILVHCIGGRGRSALAAATVLIACGASLDKALEALRERLDTLELSDEQLLFLELFESLHRSCAAEIRSCSLCAG